MPDPQVKERVKEVPARGLRAIFAGIGSLLGVSDKIRNKPAATAPETTATPESGAVKLIKPEETAAPEQTAAPEAPVVADTVVAETTAAPEATVVAEDTAAPEATVVAEETAAPEAAVAPAATDALPLANYDELSVASLRARLRNLSPEQLTQLIEYEKGHAGRADVITMFERRIAKLAAEA
jgi:hypothetical protein